MKGLQRRGKPIKKGSSKRLDNLNRKLKELIKNEVGKAINELFEQNQTKIIMEDVSSLTYDLSDCKLSKNLKRLISNSCMAQAARLIERRSGEQAVKLEKQNRAYTSLECQRCHHIDKKSRDGEQFSCTKCKFISDADFNAAVVIKQRSSLNFFNSYTPRSVIKQTIMEMSELYFKNGTYSLPMDSLLADFISKKRNLLMKHSKYLKE